MFAGTILVGYLILIWSLFGGGSLEMVAIGASLFVGGCALGAAKLGDDLAARVTKFTVHGVTAVTALGLIFITYVGYVGTKIQSDFERIGSAIN